MKKTFEIVTKPSLGELESFANARINRYLEDNNEEWEIEGSPFYDSDTQEWNVAIKRVLS